MTQKVIIRKGEKVFRVNFIYNNDLIDIMHDHKGWYYKGEKAWQFQNWKFDTLYDDLTDKKYKVEIKKLIIKEKPTTQKTLKIDYFKEPTVIAVWGKCKKCGHIGYVDKENLCVRCK